MLRLLRHPGLPRVALLTSLALFWLNFLLTSRWAAVPGALHGPKRPVFVAILIAATVLALLARRPGVVAFGTEARIAAAIGLASLVGCFFVWFPPNVWNEIPFLDNWPARFQSTVDGIALLRRGTFVGWQWHYLGGYHSSSDLTVALTIPALLPILAFGERVGFHLAHLLLFAAVPILVWIDFRVEGQHSQRVHPAIPAPPAALPALVCGLVSISTLGLSYVLLRSGDTNSLAGVVTTLLAMVGSHATAAGRRWGPYALVGGLTLIIYSHTGFLVYAAILLLAEAAFYRDLSRLIRAALALAAATIAGLPLTWESWKFPEYFIFNNVLFDPTAPIDWLGVIRKIYYNVELLALPGRWLNDSIGLTTVCLPLIVFVAWTSRHRAGFYAAAALTVMVITRFNVPEVGYAFVRPFHLLCVFTPPVIGAFAIEHSGRRSLALALTLVVASYLQVLVRAVPHVPSVEDYQPALVERLRTLDGALVLVENTYHRDMIAAADRESAPTPFPAHFQSLLAAETGKRLYAGIWDGWQWSPYRGQLVAAGAWMGRAIDDWPRDRFMAELRRWGIRHLLVIHEPTRRYLTSAEFVRHDDAGPYAHFELLEADTRSVVTGHGTGRLRDWDPLGARIDLDDVRAGDRVIVRTNYHPAWIAQVEGERVPMFAADGQLAFEAPADGTYEVRIEYPRRPWLFSVALIALAGGVMAVGRIRRFQPPFR